MQWNIGIITELIQQTIYQGFREAANFVFLQGVALSLCRGLESSGCSAGLGLAAGVRRARRAPSPFNGNAAL